MEYGNYLRWILPGWADVSVDGCWVVEGVVGEHGVGVSVADPVVAQLGGQQLHGER